MMNKQATADTNKEPTADMFGLIANFPGDELKLEAAASMLTRLRSTEASMLIIGVNEIVQVLDQLPFQGRIHLVLQGIGKSPACREIVKRLFDWCFAAEEPRGKQAAESKDAGLDQDFLVVLPASLDLNPLRTHVLRVLILAAGGLGEAGDELCRDYLATSSTIFRSFVLQSMVKSTGIADDEIEQLYHASVVNHQESIVATCQQVTHRCKLLQRLYEKGLVPFNVLFVDPDSSVIQPILEAKITAGFRKWKLHSALYLGMLETSFQKLAHDPLGRGKALRAWEKRCEGATDFSDEHALQVLNICEIHRPMQVISSTEKYVETMLHKASAAGELGKVPTDLKQVVQAFPDCRKKINKQQYVAWIMDQVQPCSDSLGVGFVNPTKEKFLSREIQIVYPKLGDFVPNYLDQVSYKLFWQGKRETGSSNATCSVRFFRVVTSIVVSVCQGRRVNMAREVLDAWCRLHMRCKPPKDKNEESKSDWDRWRKSYMGAVLALTKNVARRHDGAIRRSAPMGLSSATLWVGFSGIILEMEVAGYMSLYEAGIVDKRELVLNLLKAFEFVEMKSSHHGSFMACHALAEQVAVIVQTNIFPVLDTFDTSQDDDRDSIVKEIVPLITRLCQTHWKDRPGVLVPLAHRIWAFSQQALPPDELMKNPCFDKSSTDADGRIVRTFYRADVAKQRACADALISTSLLTIFQQLCMHCSVLRTGEETSKRHLVAAAMPVDDIQQEIQSIFGWFDSGWILDVLKGEVLIGSKFESIKDRLSLVRLVATAWPGIVETEAPSLIALGKQLISAEKYKYERFRGDFTVLGIDGAVLDGCDEKLRREFLVIKNTNVAASGVRAYLEEQTTGRDPAERMNGYVRLLNLSLETSLTEFARSVKFVASRTKNEAGIYRSSMLDFLVRSAYQVVEKSFEESHAATSAEHERMVVDTARIVCESYTKMFRDDVAKRDTVGMSRFLSISLELLLFCLGSTAGRLVHSGLELHSVWVTEALRLQWIRAEVTGGEAQLRDFNWQLPNVNMGDNWVDTDSVALISPLLENEILMRRIRASVHSGCHWADAKSLELAERVSLLQTGLMSVKEQHAEQNSDSTVVVAGGGLSELQLKSLFSFTKQRWVQVPVLIKAMEEASPERNFDRAYQTFTHACSLYIEVLWCHVPLLASACESLLRTTVKENRSDEARHVLYRYWLPMRKRLAAIDFSSVEEDPAAISFFLSFLGGPLKAEISAVVRKHRKHVPDEFSCSTARTLLDMTRSSWYLADVKDAVERSRDDILGDLLESGKNTAGSSPGVFRGERVDPPVVFIKPAIQMQLRSSALRLYTDFCLSDALSRNNNVQYRSSRITEFVEAPCTGHRDILRLLEELEEGPLLEALLLSIFRVDSAWKVLAYLLRPSVIARRSPRTTGGLLDRVASTMHARDVELVFSILLAEGPRQKALTTYLTKCILRALFEIDSETAAGLVRDQWNRGVDLHKDVRHDLVRLALLTIAPSLEGSASGTGHLLRVAWEIVESSCADPDLESDSAVLILAPQWTSSSFAMSSFVQVLMTPHGLRSFQLPQVPDSAKEDAFRALNSKLGKAQESAALGLRLDYAKLLKTETCDAINRYRKALCVLSEKNASAAVQVKARCHSHVFSVSCLLGLDERSVEVALKEVRSALKVLLAHTEALPPASNELDVYENYELIALASLLATFTMHVIERKYWSLPAEVRTKDDVEAITAVMKENNCVKIIVAFLEDCAEALLPTPLHATSRVLSLAAVLQVIPDNVNLFSKLPGQKLSKLLFEPLSKQMQVLKMAGSAMSSMPMQS